jgi:hypothetical protein
MDDLEKGLGGVGILLVIALIWQWSTINNLNDKVNACAWQLDVANVSISDANNEIADAKNKAGGTYYEMNYTLQNLGGEYASRENPCAKDYTGDISLLPKDN